MIPENLTFLVHNKRGNIYTGPIQSPAYLLGYIFEGFRPGIDGIKPISWDTIALTNKNRLQWNWRIQFIQNLELIE
jgi:hypothetical protein